MATCSNQIYLKCCLDNTTIIKPCKPTVDGFINSTFVPDVIYVDDNYVCWQAFTANTITIVTAVNTYHNYTSFFSELPADCDQCLSYYGNSCLGLPEPDSRCLIWQISENDLASATGNTDPSQDGVVYGYYINCLGEEVIREFTAKSIESDCVLFPYFIIPYYFQNDSLQYAFGTSQSYGDTCDCGCGTCNICSSTILCLDTNGILPYDATYLIEGNYNGKLYYKSTCECFLWDVVIDQTELDASTGNTIYSSSTIYVTYFNCDNDLSFEDYGVSGTYLNDICIRGNDVSIFYYQDDLRVDCSISTVSATTNCCQLNFYYIFYDGQKWCLSNFLGGPCFLFGSTPCNVSCPDIDGGQINFGECTTTTTTSGICEDVNFEAIFDCLLPTPTPTATLLITPTPTPTLTLTSFCSMILSSVFIPGRKERNLGTTTTTTIPNLLCYSGDASYILFDGRFKCSTTKKLVDCNNGEVYYVTDPLEIAEITIDTGLVIYLSINGNDTCVTYEGPSNISSNAKIDLIYNWMNTCDDCDMVTPTPTSTPTSTPTPTATSPCPTLPPTSTPNPTRTPAPTLEPPAPQICIPPLPSSTPTNTPTETPVPTPRPTFPVVPVITKTPTPTIDPQCIPPSPTPSSTLTPTPTDPCPTNPPSSPRPTPTISPSPTPSRTPVTPLEFQIIRDCCTNVIVGTYAGPSLANGVYYFDGLNNSQNILIPPTITLNGCYYLEDSARAAIPIFRGYDSATPEPDCNTCIVANDVICITPTSTPPPTPTPLCDCPNICNQRVRPISFTTYILPSLSTEVIGFIGHVKTCNGGTGLQGTQLIYPSGVSLPMFSPLTVSTSTSHRSMSILVSFKYQANTPGGNTVHICIGGQFLGDCSLGCYEWTVPIGGYTNPLWVSMRVDISDYSTVTAANTIYISMSDSTDSGYQPCPVTPESCEVSVCSGSTLQPTPLPTPTPTPTPGPPQCNCYMLYNGSTNGEDCEVLYTDCQPVDPLNPWLTITIPAGDTQYVCSTLEPYSCCSELVVNLTSACSDLVNCDEVTTCTCYTFEYLITQDAGRVNYTDCIGSGNPQFLFLPYGSGTTSVCASEPPTAGPGITTLTITSTGACSNLTNCDSTINDCNCYEVVNDGADCDITYTDCDTQLPVTLNVLANTTVQVCSLDEPTGAGCDILVTRIGVCVGGVCQPRPYQFPYYPIKVNNVWVYSNSSTARAEHINYVLCQGFNVYQIYGLYTVFASPTLSSELATFVDELYAAGLRPVAMMGDKNGMDLAYDWEQTYGRQFWGVNLENEFWHYGNPNPAFVDALPFTTWINIMNYVRVTYPHWHRGAYLANGGSSGDPPPWGILEANQIIAAQIDVIEVTNYNSGEPNVSSYGFLNANLQLLANAAAAAGVIQQFVPLWSSESAYSGPYFALTPPDLTQPLTAWYNDYLALSYTNKNSMALVGLCLFDYNDLVTYLPQCLTPTSTTTTSSTTTTTTLPPVGMPVYNHVFIAWFENKSYSSIVGSSQAPYINNVLIAGGTLFTNFYAYGQPSQPNYISAFAGSNLGCTSNTQNQIVPSAADGQHTQANLWTALNSVGKTFETYAQSLPSAGSTVWTSGAYVGRHDPARNFNQYSQSIVRKPFTSIPANLNTCANVVYLIPDNSHNMHDNTISSGDNWLGTDPQMQSIIQYCANPANNSLFVLYWDEGVTGNNKLAITFYGANVLVGNQVSTTYGTPPPASAPYPNNNGHYCFTKTILYMYGAPYIGNTASATLLTGWWV